MRPFLDAANAALAKPEHSTQGLLRTFDVRVVCATDDPIDDRLPGGPRYFDFPG